MAPSGPSKTGLSGAQVGEQLASTSATAANLAAACQGILDTRLSPSPSHWYGPLSAELHGLQRVAERWREQHEARLRDGVLAVVARCGQEFRAARGPIDQLFAEAEREANGARARLQAKLSGLRGTVRAITTAVASYEAGLKGWGQELRQAHDLLGSTIRKIQDEAAGLQSEISTLNAAIGSMQAEIIRDRQAIARARSERDKGIVETIFGVLLAPVTGGLSLILAGIGVSSIAEAEAKVRSLEQLIAGHLARIVAAQQNLTQDQAQVATLQGLTLSGGIALSDAESALKLLDAVRTTWDAFGQEMEGVIAKIGKAEGAVALAVERAWWNAACKEWDLIASGAQALAGARLRAAAPRSAAAVGSPGADPWRPGLRLISAASTG